MHAYMRACICLCMRTCVRDRDRMDASFARCGWCERECASKRGDVHLCFDTRADEPREREGAKRASMRVCKHASEHVCERASVGSMCALAYSEWIQKTATHISMDRAIRIEMAKHMSMHRPIQMEMHRSCVCTRQW